MIRSSPLIIPFRYNQITEQCEFHDKHKFDKYRVVDEREFNTLVINAIEEGVNCMDRDMRRYLGSSRIPSSHPVTAYLEHLPHWDGHDRVSELARSVSDERNGRRRFISGCWAW